MFLAAPRLVDVVLVRQARVSSMLSRNGGDDMDLLETKAKRFRSELGGLCSSRRRFSETQLIRGIELAEALDEAGIGVCESHRLLGVSKNTIRRWLDRVDNGARVDTGDGALVPVVVSPSGALPQPAAAASPALTLVSPFGWRVEGLRLSDVAELMRRSAT